jgi:glycosyltransferase involved in cell wall biosynthesis
VGGGLAREQRALAEELGVAEHIVTLPPLARETLAEVYRRADVTLLPSEREGFGWPVAESLAVGTPVVASDLPALREVGGTAAEYAPVGDVACWISRVEALWREKQAGAAAWETRRNHVREHGGKFSRTVYAHSLLAIYEELLKF